MSVSTKNHPYKRLFQRFFISQGLRPRTVLTHQMPCIRPNHRNHRRFLPHFPPGPMRCEFSPELVPSLPHAMMEGFPKSESEARYGLPSPLTPTTFPRQLIPKPPGEVSRVGRGGYTLKDLLEEQHGWKNGLYDTIRVFATHSHTSVILRAFSGKGSLNGGQIFGHDHRLFFSREE